MKVNQSKLGVLLSYITAMLGYIILILYTPIMLKLLGQSQYGLYNLVASVVGYLGLISFGFSSAYMKYYSRYKVQEDDENIAILNGMFMIIYCCMAVVAMGAGSIFVLNIKAVLGKNLLAEELESAKILMIVMIINIAISFPATVFNAHVTANEEFIFQKLLQLIKTVANPFVMLPVLLMGYKAIGIAVATTVLNLTIEIFNAMFCIKKLKIKFKFSHFNFKLFKEMAIFSSYIFLNMIIDQINWSIDKFIIGRYRGTVAVAVYGLGAQLNTYYMGLATTVSNVFIPRIHRMIAHNEEKKELTILLTKVGRIQFMILALILTGFALLGRTFIELWAGKEYAETYFIILLLIVPVTMPLVQTLGYEVQKAMNRHKFRSWMYFFVALANVAMSIPLTKRYGGVGAALGTAISLLIGNVLIMNWYYYKQLKLDMKYFWKEIIKLVPAVTVPMLVVGCNLKFINLYDPMLFILSGTIYVIVFCSCLWLFGMNQYEKDLLLKPILVLKHKVQG